MVRLMRRGPPFLPEIKQEVGVLFFGMAAGRAGIHSHMSRCFTSWGLTLVLLCGCDAELGGGDSGSSNSGAGASPGDGDGAPGVADDTPSDWTPDSEGGDPDALTTFPLRIITSSQFEATVDLIFRDHYAVNLPDVDIDGTLQAEFVDDSGFLTVGEVTEVSVLRYLDAARDVVAALGDAGVDAVAGCDVGAEVASNGCIRQMVSDLGRLLYRRPLSEAETMSHTTFWDEEVNELQSSSREATEQLLTSMLSSPYFLYRWELSGAPAVSDGAIRLTPFQIASRLSFFLWGSGPSSELIQLAEDGGLATDEQVGAQAVSMLQDPRAEEALRVFHRGWLHLEKLDGLFKDPARFPEWGPALSQAMQREVEEFTQHVILADDGRLATLLQAPYSFVNEPLAGVYGVAGVTGDDFVQVTLPAGERSGLLTMAGLLAAASEPSVENPFKRGKLLLEQIMCRKLEPPANVPPIPPPDEANPEPIRDTLEELTGVSPCSGCHQHINPLGFGLGNYDAIGGFQTEDELGFPVDPSGVLTTGETFTGPASLSATLSEHVEVKGCVTKQWFRFAMNRAENSGDDYSLETAYGQFAGTDFNIRELVQAITTTRSFLYRAPDAGEVIQ